MSLKIKKPKQKNFERPFSSDIISEFHNFLSNQGVAIKGQLKTDGSVDEAHDKNDPKKKRKYYYFFYLDQDYPYGELRRYSDQGEAFAKFRPKNVEKLTDDQRQELNEVIKQKQIEAEKKQKESQNKAAKRAQSDWERGKPVESHPYLEKKQVSSYGLREDYKGRLMIPLYNAKRKIVGIQYIKGDGTKRFLTGTKKKGSFFTLGGNQLKNTNKINYCEGYATAASFYEDHNEPVVVAFDAGNLSPVAEIIFKDYQNHEHIFIADNDESETGEREASKACQLIKSKGGKSSVKMPKELGDYNDHKNTPKVLEGQVITKPELQDVDVPMAYTRGPTGRILNIASNFQVILDKYQIKIFYDVMRKDIEISIPDKYFIEDFANKAKIKWIEDQCRQNLMSSENVKDYIFLLAKEKNEVLEWVESKPWDGVSRIQEFLNTITAQKDEELKEILMRKWLISCFAALAEPHGISLEGILVFQGTQGLGKTMWFKRLADYDKGWLLEGATINPSDRDSVKQAVSHWIVELGELESTFKKSDIDQLKAFVTKKSDILRLMYDSTYSKFARRTAFYASVNAKEFLTDTSGNRRFWVVPVKKINWNHGIDMQQLWAEVKETMYIPGESNWFLTPDERKWLDKSNEIYRTQSTVEDLLLENVHFDSVQTKPVQLTKLLRDLGIANPRMPDFKEAARVLDNHGKEPRRSNGKKVYDLDYNKSGDDEYPKYNYKDFS